MSAHSHGDHSHAESDHGRHGDHAHVHGTLGISNAALTGAPPAFSLLTSGIGVRAAVAAALIAGLWLVTFWALRP